MKILSTLVIVCICSGCSLLSKPGVPATVIKFNPKTDALNISSPKDVNIQSVDISQGSNGFRMMVTGYSSTNNAALVGVVVNAQAAIASNAAVTINKLAELGAQAVSKAP